MRTAGLLLAAGAGRRFGRPKALVEVEGEALVTRAVRVLAEGGCDPIVVVLGARADDVRTLLPGRVTTVYVPDWQEGMSASLREGLRTLSHLTPVPDAVLVHLVDLPGVGSDVVARLRESAAPDAVARASYDGHPGHPVVLGRRWWSDIADVTRGDQGAREWLRGRADLRLVECGDLSAGTDVDSPADLPGDRRP
ncbi:NTP transferase domain-containing protein [Saccharomonospora sp. NB11]|uniref:nucleotidyltransferase family protein n=1 Tax=Saccharomonospora sp. NB11 TaxID=1642298 RepID=UPI0018D1C12B|nr:nucleotidyltransferase family protein [Saccharomonospora sp. NB11]